MTILFRADLADGSSFCESDGTWDQAPDKIRRLSLYNATTGREYAALEAIPGRSFWFCNEGRASIGASYGVLAAKLIGAVDGDTATEVRLDLLGGEPRVSERRVAWSVIRLSESALRISA